MRIALAGIFPKDENQVFEGIMRVMSSLAESLAMLPDTDVTVLTPHRMRHLFRKTEKQTIRGLTIQRMNYIAFACHMLSRNAYDIVNIHGVSFFTALTLLYRIRNRYGHAVYTTHGLVAMEKSLGYTYTIFMPLYEKLLMRYTDLITTVSASTKEFILRHYRVNSEKVTVIGNGVDAERFKPVSIHRQKQQSKCRILFVGTLLPVKGLDFLFASIQNIKLPFTLDVVGKETPYFHTLRNKYKDLFSSQRIQLHGSRTQNELKQMYAKSDFLVLTSFYDQYPQVVLEAQAMGKPAVLSDRIGSSDLIQDGKNGYVIPYGNCPALKQTIEYLIQHPEKYRQMGKFSRAVAQKNRWKDIAVQYRQFFPHPVCLKK